MRMIKQKLLVLLSGPVLLHYTLPIVMVYLIIGTIAQKYIGLYQATSLFFSSPIFWAGPVPLPGLPIFLALIFINLSFKVIWKSPWNKQNSGIMITHIGAMLLLLGGLFTALFSHESYIDFSVGQEKNITSDYNIREVALISEDGKDIKTFNHNEIFIGDELDFPEIPMTITIEQTCKNCAIIARDPAEEKHLGLAKHMQLLPAPLQNLDEENMSGISFIISGSNEDGVYLALENVPKYPEFSVDGKKYKLILRRQEKTLPFSITLLEFTRDMHPGTSMAKSYQSRVLIKDGKAQWESLIQMNEPLRYKGYSFFQSSFVITPQGDISVLAVVWNAGRSFPYVSGLVMCFGMIVHLFMRKKKRKNSSSSFPSSAK